MVLFDNKNKTNHLFELKSQTTDYINLTITVILHYNKIVKPFIIFSCLRFGISLYIYFP